MAVDIVLTVNGKKAKYNEETSIRFSDEGSDGGDFCFLQPFFEKLRTQTGQVIDLYDDCVFENDNLNKLQRALIGEINSLKSETFEQKDVHTGTQIYPIKKEIYKPVVRQLLIDKLEKWRTITELAIQKNEKLIGIGD